MIKDEGKSILGIFNIKSGKVQFYNYLVQLKRTKKAEEFTSAFSRKYKFQNLLFHLSL